MPEIHSGLEFRNLLEVSHLLPTRAPCRAHWDHRPRCSRTWNPGAAMNSYQSRKEITKGYASHTHS